MFFLVSGEIEVYKNGKKTTTLSEPCAFGEWALESNGKWQATIKASQDVQCLVLLKKDYEAIVAHEDPKTFGVSVCTVDG